MQRSPEGGVNAMWGAHLLKSAAKAMGKVLFIGVNQGSKVKTKEARENLEGGRQVLEEGGGRGERPRFWLAGGVCMIYDK